MKDSSGGGPRRRRRQQERLRLEGEANRLKDEFISTEHNAIRNLAHQLNLKLEDANKLSLGDEETYLIDGVLYSEDQLMDVWVGELYDIMKRAQMDAPWQPQFDTLHTPEHLIYDNLDAIEASWLEAWSAKDPPPGRFWRLPAKKMCP